MSHHRPPSVSRLSRLRVAILAALCGLLALAAVAAARSFTLHSGHATVTNTAGMTRSETIVLTSHGFATYLLTGDSRHHPECTSSACLHFWPPVTVRRGQKPSAGPGVHGTLRTWRHNGFTQVTLNGHPLYRYAGDSRRGMATGEGIVSFGGTWHVIKAGRSTQPTAPAPSPGGGY